MRASRLRSRACVAGFVLCERGDNENLGRLLLLALVLVPLILLVALFGDDVIRLARQAWSGLPEPIGGTEPGTALVPCVEGMPCFEE